MNHLLKITIIFSIVVILFGFYELSYKNDIFAQSKSRCCNNGLCNAANCISQSSINSGSLCNIHYYLTCKECIDLEISGCIANCSLQKNIFCYDINGLKYFGTKILCEENK